MNENCKECGLYHLTNHPCIKGRGILDKTTNLFLIGEAPGPDEARKGRVFVGRAGKKLDAMIKPFVDDLNVYITNTVKCYPPVSVLHPEKGFRVPKMSEIELCRPFLLEELAQASNTVLLMPLGNTALTTLLKTDKHEGITKVAGKLQSLTLENGTVYTMLPNYHPSYVIRNRKVEPEFLKVMGIAVKFLHGEITCPDNLQENNNV